MSDERTPPAEAARPRPRIAITMGDPNGVGPEVVLKCLADARLAKYLEPVLVGVPHVFKVHAAKVGLRELHLEAAADVPEALPERGLAVVDVAPEERVEVAFGKGTEASGRLAMAAVARAVDLCLDGKVDAMVTAPISKEAIARAGFAFPGHTEFIAERTGTTRFTMMMVADTLRVGLVTGHVPIWDVPKLVTREHIVEKIRILSDSLQRDFGVQRPKIAVLGLNPHAGDGGVLGREEAESIVPAIQQACEQGHLAFGPFPADGFFAIAGYQLYDAVLAMYHDQGLVPFKTLAFESGVNYTAGLPIVRTSPDHGTAYNIAGQGKASPGSMRSALYVAIDIARLRRRAPAQTEEPGDA